MIFLGSHWKYCRFYGEDVEAALRFLFTVMEAWQFSLSRTPDRHEEAANDDELAADKHGRNLCPEAITRSISSFAISSCPVARVVNRHSDPRHALGIVPSGLRQK